MWRPRDPSRPLTQKRGYGRWPHEQQRNNGALECRSGRTAQQRARESATTAGGHGDHVSTKIDSGLRDRNAWRSPGHVRHHLPLRRCCMHAVEHLLNVVFHVFSVHTAARIVFLDNAQQDQVCLQ